MLRNPKIEQPLSGRLIFAELTTGRWITSWYQAGYWMDGSNEMADDNIVHWAYPDDLSSSPIHNLIHKVEGWAHERNLIQGSDSKAQFHKLIQEAAELSDNICKGNDIRDDIGDMLVVLIIIAKQHAITIQDCLGIAYEDIKDRKGQMINGVFVKEADLMNEARRA